MKYDPSSLPPKRLPPHVYTSASKSERLYFVIGLIIAAIIGYFGLAIMARHSHAINHSLVSTRLNAITIKQAASAYFLSVEEYPAKVEDLVVRPTHLPKSKRWDGPYLENGEIPVDSWNGKFRFRHSKKTDTFSVDSAGPDGKFDTNDDVIVEG